MQIQYDTETSRLLVQLDGEIDHHSSNALRAEVDAAIYAHLPQTLILDFGKVSFMDSSGIAVVMRCRQRMRELGGTLTLYHVPTQPRKVFDASGVSRLVAIE